MDEEKKSLFQKIGHSLKLEDEQYEEALPHSDNEPAPQNDIDQEVTEETMDQYEEPVSPEAGQGGQSTPAPEEEHDQEPRVTLTAAGSSGAATQRKTQPKTTVDNNEEETEEGRLTVDVYETDNEIVIKSTIAGVSPSDLDIDITSDSVSIRGARPKDENISPENYFYQETYWGPFSRTIILPTEIDPNNSEATMKNGILTVRLKKLSTAQQKKLKVKVE